MTNRNPNWRESLRKATALRMVLEPADLRRERCRNAAIERWRRVREEREKRAVAA